MTPRGGGDAAPADPAVVAAVRRWFPDDEAAALADLAVYTGATPAARARLQLRVLELVAGDRAKLAHDVAAARQDYRDVLSWAELRFGPAQVGP